MNIDKQIARIKRKLESRKILDPNTGCWLYNGNLDRKGYGRVTFLSKGARVHRLSAYLYLGMSYSDFKNPNILVLHKNSCHNPQCFNPAHLYTGSYKQNALDRVELITHCPKGHTLLANTYVYTNPVTKIVYKWCATCKFIANQKRRKSPNLNLV